jgi:hypothetical protein
MSAQADLFGPQGPECPYMTATRCDRQHGLRCACGYIDEHLGPHHCKHCGRDWEGSEPTEARARASDPETAKSAAAALVTGTVETAILEALATPLTIYEVSQRLAALWPPTTISPRFRPMERRGFIREQGQRTNPNTGRPAIAWVAVAP